MGVALIFATIRTELSARGARALACIAALILGFSYAGGRAQWRMADALPFADEGRDVAVTGLITSLPVRLERGVRIEFDEERHEAGVAVPDRILLGWYAVGQPVRPGERWKLIVRLRRPHGAMNPGGFDFEAWMWSAICAPVAMCARQPEASRSGCSRWSGHRGPSSNACALGCATGW